MCWKKTHFFILGWTSLGGNWGFLRWGGRESRELSPGVGRVVGLEEWWGWKSGGVGRVEELEERKTTSIVYRIRWGEQSFFLIQNVMVKNLK